MSQLTLRAPGFFQLSRYAGPIFLALVLVQGFHEVEHVVQVLQRYVFGNPRGAGFLGTWVDVEPLHFAYNAVFLLLVAVCFVAAGYHRGMGKRHHMLAFWFMAFALHFQVYHFVEHVFKIAQFIDTGRNGTPGIIGNFFNIVWVHFFYNTIEYIPIVLAFVIDGYHKEAAASLRDMFSFKAPPPRRA